jgi:hypothetical protein
MSQTVNPAQGIETRDSPVISRNRNMHSVAKLLVARETDFLRWLEIVRELTDHRQQVRVEQPPVCGATH